MFKIKVNSDGEVGYFCGMFTIKGEKLCGYEDNINHEKVKEYKRKQNAEKTIKELNDNYKSNDTISFEIVEIE